MTNNNNNNNNNNKKLMNVKMSRKTGMLDL